MTHVAHYSGTDVGLGNLIAVVALAAIGAYLAGIIGAIIGIVVACLALCR